MDFKELIKRLNHYSAENECHGGITAEAADAIENLLKERLAIGKVIKMFRPSECDFLGFPAKDVICGPNDRAMFGFDTNFPIDWIVEDYGFTREEAEWFVRKVRELHND